MKYSYIIYSYSSKNYVHATHQISRWQ